MVFHETDSRSLYAWTPSLNEWKGFVAYNIDLPHLQESLPQMRDADIIISPLTKGTARKPRNEKELKQSNIIQLAYREYRAFEPLARSLIGVISIA